MADARRPEAGDLTALLRDLAGALFGTDTVLRLVELGVFVPPVSEAKLRRPGRGDVDEVPPPTLLLRPGRGDLFGEVMSTLLLLRPGLGDLLETLSAAILRVDSVLLPAPGRGDREDAGRGDASPPTTDFRLRGVVGAASICFIDSGAETRRDDLRRGDEGTGEGGACSCIDGSSSSSDPDSPQ